MLPLVKASFSLPKIYQRQQERTKAMPQVGGASLGQRTISMFHTQNTMLLSKAPATWKYAMRGGKPLRTAKERSYV